MGVYQDQFPWELISRNELRERVHEVSSGRLDESWRENAFCVRPEIDGNKFYPGKHEDDVCETPKEAMEICQTQCSVRLNCLIHAIVNREIYGVWGGMSERKRFELIKEFGQTAV